MCEVVEPEPSREMQRKGAGQVAEKSISAMDWINNRSRGSGDKKCHLLPIRLGKQISKTPL